MSKDRRSSGAAGDEMHVAAHRPQEILAAAEQLQLVLVEHVMIDQFLDGAHAIDIFAHPEQRVQIAQAALAVLHVGLDEVARLPGLAQPLLALGELGGHEFMRGALHDILVEARDQFLEQLLVAEQKACFEHRGADGHVRLGLADAFVDRARRVADLQAHVPETIENRFGDRLAPGGLLVGKHEQQIDVGAGRQQAAAIAAGRDHRHAFGFGRIERRIKMLGGEFEQDADDLVLHDAEPLGAAASVPVLEQQFLGLGAALDQRGFQILRDGGAQFALAPAEFRGELFEIGGGLAGVENVGRAARRLSDCQHGSTG